MQTTFQQARAEWDEQTLMVSTGTVTRRWVLAGAGLKTTGLRDETGAFEWPLLEESCNCDWEVPGVDANGHTGCRVEDVRMTKSTDEGFTSPHLAVELDLLYPGPVMRVRFCVWAYPGVPGLRTQLWLRPGASKRLHDLDATGRAEHLPIDPADAHWHAAGYYNETQARNKPGLDLLKEWRAAAPHAAGETVVWPCLADMRVDGHALILVKESHKCVNQTGCDTGVFQFEPGGGLASTGWGMAGSPLDPTRYHPAWPHWCLCAGADDVAVQEAVKRFDATRYPGDTSRDVYMISNTWGSRGPEVPKGRGSRDAAREDNVLREIDIAADLGIDVVQIDDGWQVPDDRRGWLPDHDHGWRPHPDLYPDGWTNVRHHARARGVRLGLWSAAQWISLDELIENEQAGGFTQWKLDFADLRRHEDVWELAGKVRAFALASNHRVRMNFDATEVRPRFGYYFGREFGCIYLANRKPYTPEETVYVPHLMLRDLWQLAHYTQLQRFQGTIQNVKSVNPERTDAQLHDQSYAVAVALASTPVFFMELQTLEEGDREQIRPLLQAYRRERESMYRSIVYPIGDQPDNTSWSGFQCHRADESVGHLLVFRERLNKEPSRAIRLHRLAGRSLRITDCLSGEARKVRAADNGEVEFEIPQAAGFVFLRYETRS